MERFIRSLLAAGQVIPAVPLALDAQRRLDEVHQRALCRYYSAAGAGGLAVGVHTTEFAIREVGLLDPILALVSEEADRADVGRSEPLVRIAGACGGTRQACHEAALAREHGYHLVLLSLSGQENEEERSLIAHCEAVAEELPLMGFYLQRAVGGCMLPYRFWRRLTDLENLVAIKIAPFNRYQTVDVVRAVAESGRTDISLYTGNDDNIVPDLVTPFRWRVQSSMVCLQIVGGLLGQWSVGTRAAVSLLADCHKASERGEVPDWLLWRGTELTDCNAAIFDVSHNFAGCLPGIHEVLRRQGLLGGTWCLDPGECLSPGQMAELDRVHAAYPHLYDDEFIRQNLDEWLDA
jgi:Dihydrodipicolinate synthetase family